MKKLILTSLVTFMNFFCLAQSTPYNPFTQNIHFSPEPTAQGIQNCGPIDLGFTMGMTTADDATDWVNNPLQIRVCVSGFVLRSQSAATAVYGDYSRFFDWTVEGDSCVIGIQKDTMHGTGYDPFNIHPDASGLINVRLIIPAALPVPSTAGVSVALTVPSYMDTFNTPGDDPEQSFTQNYLGYTSVSGTLYDDSDTGDDPLGTPSGRPDNVSMFVNVVDSATGLVEGATMIDSNGTYLADSLTVNRTYTVQLTSNQGVKGQSPPPIQLPPGWGFTDEDCCDSFSSDGLPNGLLVDIQATTCPVIFANFGISSSVFLAVNDLAFTTTEVNCDPVLSWAKPEDNDIKLYEILRKEVNGGEYKKIGEVVPNEKNKRYSFVDQNRSKSKNSYNYQLRIIDFTNRTYFSPTRTINLTCDHKNMRASLYPNPAKEALNFLYENTNSSEGISMMILDVAGKTLYNETMDIESGQNNIILNINHLPAGYYMLKYQDFHNIEKGSLKFTVK